jgi:hypothetical protein
MHLDENARLDRRNHGDAVYDNLIMRLFMRYLVWREHTAIQEEDEAEDEQSSITALTTLLAENNEEGTSLADMPRVSAHTGYQGACWSASRIATYTLRGDVLELVYVLGKTVSKKHRAEDKLETPTSKEMCCSGRTRAKKACRTRKVVDANAETWNCGRHGV